MKRRVWRDMGWRDVKEKCPCERNESQGLVEEERKEKREREREGWREGEREGGRVVLMPVTQEINHLLHLFSLILSFRLPPLLVIY